MKSYKEISDDIRSVLSDEITGTQLDVLVELLSMYVYNVQAATTSQLIEGNLDTAVNINSVIAKAAQFGVSVPRIVNPEVEFQAKSIASSHILYPGDEVISIGKFKFLFIGYYVTEDDTILEEDLCRLRPDLSTLIRCLVTEDVTVIENSQMPGVIYDPSISNIASKIFAYKNGQLMNLHDSFSQYLKDDGLNKLQAVTYPDYGVKIQDFNTGDISDYKIILPKALTSSKELINVVSTKAASKYVTVSRYRSNTEDDNIKITNLGSELLNKDATVAYTEKNLKLTQLIKSNTDIIAYFSDYLFNLDPTSRRYNVSFKIGDELKIYVDDLYFNTLNVNDLIPIFYIGLSGINIYAGIQITAVVRLELNNVASEEVSKKIQDFVAEYDGKFNSSVDEYDLIHKINSINSLIHINDFEVVYSVILMFGGVYYTVKLSTKNYDMDVPDLDFTAVGLRPDQDKVYKFYTGVDKFLKTSLEWI